MGDRERQEIFLGRVGRRHGQNPASGQHGSRPRFLRPDRYHGPHARRRAVRRQLLRSRARGNDGPHRHGQQPHGGRLRRGRRCGGRIQKVNHYIKFGSPFKRRAFYFYNLLFR